MDKAADSLLTCRTIDSPYLHPFAWSLWFIDQKCKQISRHGTNRWLALSRKKTGRWPPKVVASSEKEGRSQKSKVSGATITRGRHITPPLKATDKPSSGRQHERGKARSQRPLTGAARMGPTPPREGRGLRWTPGELPRPLPAIGGGLRLPRHPGAFRAEMVALATASPSRQAVVGEEHGMAAREEEDCSHHLLVSWRHLQQRKRVCKKCEGINKPGMFMHWANSWCENDAVNSTL